VLLTGRNTAKLADFGMSKRLHHQSGVASVPWAGTLSYMAPELLSFDRECTKETDVYSLGVLLWELYFGVSYTHALRADSRELSVDNALVQVRTHGLRPVELHPPLFQSELPRLIAQCWQSDPKQRQAGLQP